MSATGLSDSVVTDLQAFVGVRRWTKAAPPHSKRGQDSNASILLLWRYFWLNLRTNSLRRDFRNRSRCFLGCNLGNRSLLRRNFRYWSRCFLRCNLRYGPDLGRDFGYRSDLRCDFRHRPVRPSWRNLRNRPYFRRDLGLNFGFSFRISFRRYLRLNLRSYLFVLPRCLRSHFGNNATCF